MRYKDEYLKAVTKEMELRKNYLTDSILETVYLGGGTPSQLSIQELGDLFNAIYKRFSISTNPEITLEVNPDDLTNEYIQGLQDLPINRISMGIQSFQATDLKFLNRRHSAQQAIEAVKKLQDSGLSNISIDLIYGIPKQREDQWEENVKQALALQVPHISAYHLMFEEGTQLYKLKEKGAIESIEEEKSLWAFNHLIDSLEKAGYLHYEISNFALPGFISQHNSSYWTGKEYLGIGPSAHSYNGTQRDWNVSSLPLYIQAIEKGVPQIEGEILDTGTSYNDYIITGLRTMWGIDILKIRNLYGEKFEQYCLRQAHKFLKENLLRMEDNKLILNKKGLFLSDSIMSELLYVD